MSIFFGKESRPDGRLSSGMIYRFEWVVELDEGVFIEFIKNESLF
ncbi:hypothetical protein DB29_02448 [Shouchella clausii]|nr:hypothetical protein DB29_02448 [Shouchella clausii]